MAIDPVMASKAVGTIFSVLGKKKGGGRTQTPIQKAASNLAVQGYQTSSIATPGRPSTGDTAKKASSAELYDYYRMVAAAKLVAERLDPTSGTKLGKFGAIKDSSIG
jgi:hypothetical protein